MDLWEARAARNEALFREVNEAVERVSDQSLAANDSKITFICECSDASCSDRVVVERAVYEEVRANPRRFLVVAGHEGDVERVVSRPGRYSIVEKTGRAGDIVEANNPRG